VPSITHKWTEEGEQGRARVKEKNDCNLFTILVYIITKQSTTDWYNVLDISKVGTGYDPGPYWTIRV
jgi:hypothetical protein